MPFSAKCGVLQSLDRLARYHADRMHRALGGGAHRVETAQGPARHQDAATIALSHLDDIGVLDQAAGAAGHQRLARRNGGPGDIGEQFGRQALDDDLRPLDQVRQVDDRNVDAVVTQRPARALLVAGGHARQLDPRDTVAHEFHDRFADGYQARHTDFYCHRDAFSFQARLKSSTKSGYLSDFSK